MLSYLVRRLLQIVPTVFFISVIVYALLALKPGDPIQELRFGNPGITSEDIQRLIKLYGLDQPWYVRYWFWLGRAIQGDFGPSRRFGMPAAEYVFRYRLPNTLLLSVTALFIALVVAIPTGILSALRQHTPLDYTVTFLNFIGVSIPIFWLGLILIYVFAVHFRQLLPAGGLSTPGISSPDWATITTQTSNLLEALSLYISQLGPFITDRVRHLILPVVALSSIQMASWTRFMRSAMLEVIHLDYVRTARAKGLQERIVIFRHALRNAIAPIITLIALSIPAAMSGAVLTETVFNWPGMGRAIFESILNNDYNVAMVSLMFISFLIVLFNLLADIAYAFVDPRIRYE
uniref:Peptide/nickel transport system permease protein n=1 Tax=Acetithermum autotrophicum TaxID=1446466 RepID=H5SRT0_ACEAU|nr:peptide/nickel transport system permease protein [Candidatus Acetothermum autotrophicum]